MLSLDPWRGDEKTRQELRDLLSREESRIEQAEKLLSEIRASLE